MCGICGHVRFDRYPANSDRVLYMRNKIKHRGPDDEGLYHADFAEGGVSFGHTRLAIIDLSHAGHQPMSDASKQYWITYNGEVYNYRELKTDLKKTGFAFRSQTDTEVVLAAYMTYGTKCLALFNGMFSFAIWDSKKNRLFCARDRLGIKPFYYFYKNKNLYFASEIKALKAIPEVSSNLNSEIIYDYLSLCLIDHSNKTFYQDIYQLSPGHYFIFQGNRPKATSYWKLGNRQYNLTEDPVEKFRYLFTDSVKLRLRGDVPVGVLLSGGLDSSAIACTASEIIHPKKLKTFSSTMSGIGLDETKFSDAVSNYIEADNIKLFPKSYNFWEELDSMLYAQDEPAHASDIYANWCMMREIKRQRIKVILNGQGGDELLGGYNWYVKNFLSSLLLAGDFKDFFKEMVKLKNNFSNSITSSYLFMIANILDNLLSARIKNLYKEELRGINKVAKSSFLNSNRSRNFYNINLVNAATFNEKTKNDILYFTIPHYLHYEDRNSMAFSIEERVPFLDHRLVEWGMELSLKWKIRKGQNKYILRKALEKRIPDLVINRKDKMGLSIPIEQWFKKDFQIRLLNFFNENCYIYDEWVEKNIFLRELKRYINNKNTPIRRMVWRFFCLEKWMRAINHENCTL